MNTAIHSMRQSSEHQLYFLPKKKKSNDSDKKWHLHLLFFSSFVFCSHTHTHRSDIMTVNFLAFTTVESAGINQLCFPVVCLFLLTFYRRKIICYQTCRTDSIVQNCTFIFLKYCSETDLHCFFKLLPTHH